MTNVLKTDPNYRISLHKLYYSKFMMSNVWIFNLIFKSMFKPLHNY